MCRFLSEKTDVASKPTGRRFEGLITVLFYHGSQATLAAMLFPGLALAVLLCGHLCKRFDLRTCRSCVWPQSVQASEHAAFTFTLF